MSSLLKSSIVVSTMTLISRVFGLLRDIIMYNIFGAGLAMDVFIVAQKIPNFLRRLFAEGAFAQAFVPVLTEYQATKDKQLILTFVSRIFGTLGGILLAITLIGVLGSSGLINIFGFGFIGEPEKFILASDLLKITFPYLLFISLTAFAGSILNSLGQFAIPAFTPVLLNISMILCAIFLAPMLEQPIFSLAWGIFFAGILQLCLQLPFLWKAGYLAKPVWGWRDSGVRKVLKLMMPALFGVSVSQLNLLLDTMIASLLITGSISWLYAADRLLEFPLGIFGIAIATVILPSLSRNHLQKSQENYNKTLNWAIHCILLLGIPAASGLFLLAEPVILTLFQHGEMTLADATQSSLAMQAYMTGLVCFMLIKVLASGYFAQQDTKTPVKIGIIAMVSNMVFNLLLFKPYGHVGLAVATSLSAFINMSLLMVILCKKQALSFAKDWLFWLIRIIAANSIMILGLIHWLPERHQWQNWSNDERALYLAICIVIAALAYAMLLWLFGLRPKHLILKSHHTS